ncbi:MAG: ABC transporter permease, partial [Proteobacteria bacterium]|nr:ABC transporter permease [Pseudomonadota bacterium]
MTLRLGQLLRLSIADILDEWPFALAVTLAIAAVLAPLLVLNGLQAGVVGEIFERLRADPAMRRITLD